MSDGDGARRRSTSRTSIAGSRASPTTGSRCCGARRRSTGRTSATARASGRSPATTTSSPSQGLETYSSEAGGTSLKDLDARAGRVAQVDDRHRPAPAHAAARHRQPGLHAARRPRLRGAHPRPRPRDPRRARSRARVRLRREVAAELPMRVFSEIMGVPVEDRRLLVDLGDRLLGNTDPDVMGAEPSPSGRCRSRSCASCRSRARRAPRCSRTAASWRRDARGASRATTSRRSSSRPRSTASRLSEREFETFFLLLATAGNETTRHTLSLRAARAARAPGRSAAGCVADPALRPTAAEEMLRWAPSRAPLPPHGHPHDELHGQTIQAGDKVAIWYVSGNRDEDAVPGAPTASTSAARRTGTSPSASAARTTAWARTWRGWRSNLARGDAPAASTGSSSPASRAAALELLQRRQARCPCGWDDGDRRRDAAGSRRARDPGALHRPARRRARQGHPDRASSTASPRTASPSARR